MLIILEKDITTRGENNMPINFREVEHNLCIALDVNSVKVLNPQFAEIANAVLCYGYVDKQAGLTYDILAFVLYVDGEYSIIGEDRTVSMKVRAETYKDIEVIPIKNRALLERFKDRIEIIENVYYCGDSIELTRKQESIDLFRHPYYPDDVQVFLYKQGFNPENVWVRLTDYIGRSEGFDAFGGVLLNTPYDYRYNLSANDKVFLAVVSDSNGDTCFIVHYNI